MQIVTSILVPNSARIEPKSTEAAVSDKFLSGNVNFKLNGDRGWIMGDFENVQLPYPFFSSAFEIKWADLKKGTKKSGDPIAERSRQTLTILVSGKFKVHFPEIAQTVVLEKQGDYVFFEPCVLHTWEAIEDNLHLTLRWSAERPSK